MDLIIQKTTTKIGKFLDNALEKLLSQDNFIKRTTAIEIRAFIHQSKQASKIWIAVQVS